MKKIAIIGLGYVGLPLSLEFSKRNLVVGYDNNKLRIKSLKKKVDSNNDLQPNEKTVLKKNKNLIFTDKHKEISSCKIFIITVPTPVKRNKTPDLSYLVGATKVVSKYLKKNDLVIYESTVYPGATEEVCKPILENLSKLSINKDFYLGYSPERLSPGDSKHGLKKIVKITSGSNYKAAKMVDSLYKSIIPKGTYLTKSIKIAEAAKVIENTQRDINIAFINELAINFSKLGINTNEVLKAASTKWNFVKFQPGLVWGHCIAVDPYYLFYKSKKVGYINKLIPLARKINDHMSSFVVKKFTYLLKRNFSKKKLKILIMGLAYKEDSSDVRNSPVFDIYNQLKNKTNIKMLHIYDPLVKNKEIENKVKKIDKLNIKYDGVILAVPHRKIMRDYHKLNKKFTHERTKILDIKYMLKMKDNRICPL